MTRRLFLTLFFVALAVSTHTAHSQTPIQDAEAARFHRNLALIEALVESSLKQLNTEEPLARAEACVEAARPFLLEVQAAVEQRDPARTAELGRHLQDMLERGVVANLRAARQQIPRGSAEEPRLRQVIKRAITVSETFSAALRDLPVSEDAAEIRPVLEEILHKQPALEKALRGTLAVAIQ